MSGMKIDKFLMVSLGAALTFVCGCGPDDGQADFADGQAAFGANDLKRAERAFEKCVSLSSTNVDAVVYLARTKLGLGELADARKWIGQAVAMAGEDVDVRLLSAQIAWHAKDYGSASKEFSGIANDKGLSPEIRSQGWSGLGIVEMTCNNRDLSRVAFLRAIRLDRRNASAWYHLGLLYRDAFAYSEAALEQFNIFVRLEQTASPRVQKVQRAVIPELKESIARSAAERPGASSRDSAASAAAIGKAEAAWKKGNFKTAKINYQAALKADPLSYPAAVGLAKAWLKTDATKKGQSSALECYRQACVIRPGAISTFIIAGDLATKLGLYAQAVEIYSRAVAADPSSGEALDGLIRSLRRVGGKGAVAQAYQDYRNSLSAGK